MGGELFAYVMVGIFVLLVVFVILLGIFYPGTGAEQLDWRPTRSPEQEAANEVDDVAQMLEATNERRARRGLEPLTEEGITQRVHADKREIAKMREQHTLGLELEQVLEARNERRRRRGLPELTLDELRESLGVPPERS
ncbi:MAG TPA: hypothetical protein VGW75_15460 [Solirubrobacteraceae bacterium]|jgi:uncharacterized protein YkwD|nr:hypothetical protein [Solirubrobacteraceae bacterium]